MKKKLLNYVYLIATIAIIGMSWSCTKESVSTSSAQPQPADENALQAGEVSAANVVPGIYGIIKFIDTGDNITSDYNGYSFEFKSDGTLIATKGSSVFTGKWKLNSAQTRMTINIHGTKALNNLSDDSWKVVRITNLRINLKKPGPDQVIFSMQ